MRFKSLLPIFLLPVLGFFVAISSAQVDRDTIPESHPVDVEGLPKSMIDGISGLSVETTNSQGLLRPQAISALPPSDNCEGAPPLVITPGLNEGVSANIAWASEESSDPVLACMLGAPTRPKGYRTVWYELDALPYNRVLLDTFSSGYDTVVSVYRGTCDNLVPINCNDDTVEFTSELMVHIDDIPEPANGEEEEKYYVQIADWNPGLSPDPTLRLSVIMDPVIPEWDTVVSKPANPVISRHAVVAHGQNIYVVGGQTGGTGLPQISNQLLKFDTTSERWADPGEVNQIPGVGYSNTTAVMLNHAIYLPSGYNGNDLGYDGLHWQYDINRNSWKTVASIPTSMLPGGVPFGWAAAAAHPSQLRYYLTGGMSSTVLGAETASVSSEVYVYFPSSAGGSWAKQKAMQAGRYAHTAAWVRQGNLDLGLCVAGGLGTATDDEGNDVAIIHSSMECYQPGDEWEYKGNMVIARYGAGSALGPDGRWYIFGGRDANHEPVAQTEVYDPATNSFSVLEPEYDLGRYDTLPARFWPRGAVVGNNLWVVGGSIQEDGESALAAMDRLYIPSDRLYIPFMSGKYDDDKRNDDSFDTARHMGFGGRQYRNFDQQLDFFDFFTFNLTEERRVTIDLEVPDNNDFNLDLYGQNKLLWGSSRDSRQGDDEHITMFLQPRRYFIKVSRAYPTSQPDKGAFYTLRLN